MKIFYYAIAMACAIVAVLYRVDNINEIVIKYCILIPILTFCTIKFLSLFTLQKPLWHIFP